MLSSFYINEGTPYTGYKHVYLVAMQPGTTDMNEILFDTLAQYEKLNQSAGVEVTALQKLEFPVTIGQGIDGYRYNTGLIQAANQVVEVPQQILPLIQEWQLRVAIFLLNLLWF